MLLNIYRSELNQFKRKKKKEKDNLIRKRNDFCIHYKKISNLIKFFN